MVEFVVRARAAPVEAAAFRKAIGAGLGVEYLADILRSALFISKGHRDDVRISLVLEKSRDYSRVVTISGGNLGSLTDLHELALLEAIASALELAGGMAKDAAVIDSRGITVQTRSFEHLVKDLTESRDVYLLDPSGDDLRDLEISEDAVFVMTDHTPMPKNTYKSMARQGVKKVSLGPVMLHAAQCVTLIHNELDRQGKRS